MLHVFHVCAHRRVSRDDSDEQPTIRSSPSSLLDDPIVVVGLCVQMPWVSLWLHLYQS